MKRLAGVVSILMVAPACGARSELGDPWTPRLVAPLSTSMVTTRRPELRWTLDGADPAPAVVEMCADRACHSVLARMRASGTSATPDADLPSGVVYWRVLVSSGDGLGTASSATWEVNVPQRGAPVGTSWGTVLDVDGDGLADVAVGAPLEEGAGEAGMPGRVYLYRGGVAGLSEPPLVLTSPDAGPGEFGAHVASAGDVDGDGFGDLLVAAPCPLDAPSTCSGHVYLFRGGPSGASTTPSSTLTLPSALAAVPLAPHEFGWSIGGAGDVNGDGYADVIAMVGSHAAVYLGGPGGLATSAAVSSLPEPHLPTEKVGASYWEFNSFAAAGDIDGDGYADLLLSRGTTPDLVTSGASSSQVFTFLGGPDGLSATPGATMDGGSDVIGEDIVSLGDVDGDGFPDVAIWRAACGDPPANPTCGPVRIGIHPGGPAGISPAPATIVTPPQDTAALPHWLTGLSLTGPGDVDGDGYADLAVFVSQSHSGQETAMAYLYRGGPSGISPAAPLVVPAPGGAPSFTGLAFGVGVGVAGDVDGDGFSDVLIQLFTPSLRSVLLYRGASTGVEPTPIAITGGTGEEKQGSIARTVPRRWRLHRESSGAGAVREPAP